MDLLRLRSSGHARGPWRVKQKRSAQAHDIARLALCHALLSASCESQVSAAPAATAPCPLPNTG